MTQECNCANQAVSCTINLTIIERENKFEMMVVKQNNAVHLSASINVIQPIYHDELSNYCLEKVLNALKCLMIHVDESLLFNGILYQHDC